MVAAPCAHLHFVRGPVRSGVRGRPFNGIVRCHRGNVANIQKPQDEASQRFAEARRTIGSLFPAVPPLSEREKANLAFGLGVSPLPIGALNLIATSIWPEQQAIGTLFFAAGCLTAAGAMIIGSSLGGRRAPLLPARLGYLFGLGWLATIILGIAMFDVANGLIEGPVSR